MTDGLLLLPRPSLSASVSNPYSGHLTDGAVTLPKLTLAADALSGEAVEGSLTLPALALAANFVGRMQLPMLTLSADIANGVEVNLPLPTVTLNAVMLVGHAVTADLALPALTLSASLAGNMTVGELNLPAVALNSTLLSGSVFDGAAVLPSLTLETRSSIDPDLALPAPTMSAVAATGNLARAALSLPSLSLGGALFEDGVLNADLTLPALALNAQIASTNLITGALTLLPLTLNASVGSGNLTSAALTLPLLSLDAHGFANNIGTANLILPVLRLDAVIASSLANPVFTGVVLNTRTNAVTTYSGCAFNSLCNFNGLVLAATSTGIVALMGETDQGAQIGASMTSGVSDFQSDKLKRVIAGYAGYRAAGDMELTLITDEHHEYIYRIEPRQTAADIHPTRVKFGRGCNGLYWQWRLANKAGADFSLDSLRLDAEVLSRRV